MFVTFDGVNRGIRTPKEVSMFRFALRIHVFFAKNKIISKMFLVKTNLSYLYFVIILGIFLKRIAFVLGDLLCSSIVDIFQRQKL